MSKSKEIINILRKEFDESQIKERKGNWDQEKKKYLDFKFVSSEDVTARLTEAFGLSWGMKSLSETIVDGKNGKGDAEKYVIISVALEYIDPESGILLSVPGYGSHVFLPKEPGNTYKSALSKALSNAAKKLGVAVVDPDEDEDENAEKAATTGKSSLLLDKKTTDDKPEEVPKKELILEKKTLSLDKKVEEKTVVKEEPKKKEIKKDKEDTGGCEKCSNEITAISKDGEDFTAEQAITVSTNLFGKKYCWECLKVEKKNWISK